MGAARLLRSYHDATIGFAAPPGASWQGSTPAAAPEVVCHNDVAPYNMVFERGQPIALFDFDMAAPGTRAWDVAYAVYRFVPLNAPDGPAALREQGRRIALFLKTYGATFTSQELLAAVVARLAALRELMHARAAAGDESFKRHIEEGDAALYARDAEYVDAHRDQLLDGAGRWRSRHPADAESCV